MDVAPAAVIALFQYMIYPVKIKVRKKDDVWEEFDFIHINHQERIIFTS